jgi:hypothetical protein
MIALGTHCASKETKKVADWAIMSGNAIMLMEMGDKGTTNVARELAAISLPYDSKLSRYQAMSGHPSCKRSTDQDVDLSVKYDD